MTDKDPNTSSYKSSGAAGSSKNKKGDTFSDIT